MQKRDAGDMRYGNPDTYNPYLVSRITKPVSRYSKSSYLVFGR